MQPLTVVLSLFFYFVAASGKLLSTSRENSHYNAPSLLSRQAGNSTSVMNFTTTALTGKYVNDRTYTQPYIDIDEWRDHPIRHRYMHGGFKGTELRFAYYFPPKEQYQGRFFQGLPAVAGREDVVFQPVTLGAVIADIAPFSFETGGYTVESNQGSAGMASVLDPTINGYRGSSAAAQLSREVAQILYNDNRRPYGYVFGGSGGGYKTLACIEAGKAWEGAAPFIIGSPISIPNVFTVQAHAMRVLEKKFPQITDNIEPGGSGNINDGLNEEEKDALTEVTKFGFPPQAWFRIEKIALGYTGVFASLVDMIRLMDPTYFTDFWKLPGYLGSNPPKSLLDAKISHNTTVSRIIMTKEAQALKLPISLSSSFANGLGESPAAFILDSVPVGNPQGATMLVTSGSAKGAIMYISGIVQKNITLFGFGISASNSISKLKPGDSISIDNTVYLASQTYHRHQDPGPEYPVWDQFKENGKPKYPQRRMQMASMNLGGTGTRQSGKFDGKVIVVEAGYDEAAYPWQADWYRKQVQKNYGEGTDARFRLWMVDKAMHTSPATPEASDLRPTENTRIVSYTPIIQQALRDLTQWVEKGTAPPSSTNYTVRDGQVILPPTAKERLGIQPVVHLDIAGKLRADVNVDEPVKFSGRISIPSGMGKIVGAEFDFEGGGTFPVKPSLQVSKDGESATLESSYTFQKAGTYFVALKGYSQRSANLESLYGRSAHLGRVRVVVR